MTENPNHECREQVTEAALESWKEIAGYLKRTERTVRRWEKEEGLPVRRHLHQSRASIYAYRSELDAWVASRQPDVGLAALTSGARWKAVAGLAAVLLLTLISVGSRPTPVKAEGEPGADVVARRILDRAPYGSVSPDGHFITDVDWSTGDLAVVDLATLRSRRLTNKGNWTESAEYAESSVVSPDSKQIAYAWFNGRHYDFRVIGADGSGMRVLYDHPDVEYVFPGAWSPDGKYVTASLVKGDKANQIVLISVADGSARVLKTFDWRCPFIGPFTPDGRALVYDFPPKEDSPARDIYLLAVDGSRETTLVAHPANDSQLGWSEDGQKLLFRSDRTGSVGVWAISVREGKPDGTPRLVKSNLGRIQSLGLTENGSFYYAVGTSLRDGYIAPLDLVTGTGLGTPKPIRDSMVGTTLWPSWSQDGKSLVYLQVDPLGPRVEWTIVIRPLEGGEERKLKPDLAFGHEFRLRPSLSPDGRSIIVATRDRKGRQGIYRVDSQTGVAAPVVRAEPGTFLGLPAWSPDGRTIFYLRVKNTNESTAIVARDFETGKEETLYRAAEGASVGSFSISRDGRQIAFIRMEQTAPAQSILLVMPAAGGRPRELFRVEEPVTMVGPAAPGWTPDGRSVIVRTFRAGSPVPERILWAIPTAGGEPKKLGQAPEGHMLGIDVHPDGRHVAFTAGTGQEELWVLENLLPALKAAK